MKYKNAEFLAEFIRQILSLIDNFVKKILLPYRSVNRSYVLSDQADKQEGIFFLFT